MDSAATMDDDDILDAVVIGAGPAGLSAAIYLARFRRRFRVIHDDRSRAAWIPRSHNHPGFPDGVTGAVLLARMQEQALRYDAIITPGSVSGLRHEQGRFNLTIGDETLEARTVLLATGVEDILPPLAGAREAIDRSLLRICPICDGFEIIGLPIAVIGDGGLGAREAIFLTTYTKHVSLLHTGPEDSLDADIRQALAAHGVTVLEVAMDDITFRNDEGVATCRTPDGPLDFGAVYCALGVRPRWDLARQAGAAHGADGRLVVDDHQQTSIPGLYAAGDVVRGLNQISTAEGEAATAATAMHNLLREQQPLRSRRKL